MIRSKANKKYDSSSRKIYMSDYDSSLSSDSEWDEIRQPVEIKGTNILDHVVTDNIKNKN